MIPHAHGAVTALDVHVLAARAQACATAIHRPSGAASPACRQPPLPPAQQACAADWQPVLYTCRTARHGQVPHTEPRRPRARRQGRAPQAGREHQRRSARAGQGGRRAAAAAGGAGARGGAAQLRPGERRAGTVAMSASAAALTGAPWCCVAPRRIPSTGRVGAGTEVRAGAARGGARAAHRHAAQDQPGLRLRGARVRPERKRSTATGRGRKGTPPPCNRTATPRSGSHGSGGASERSYR
eukprot:scaffold1164_cov335-Prasinococcus_capsulatus_cf.AAC.1